LYERKLENCRPAAPRSKKSIKSFGVQKRGSMQSKVTLGRGCPVRGERDWPQCFEESMDGMGSKKPREAFFPKDI
jgi:hypothetical protein